MFPIAIGASAPRPPCAGSTLGCAAPRYLWAPSPAGRFLGEDHAGTGASAVPSENVGKGSKEGEEAEGGSAFGDARPVPPALKSWAFAAAQTGVCRGFFFLFFGKSRSWQMAAAGSECREGE